MVLQHGIGVTGEIAVFHHSGLFRMDFVVLPRLDTYNLQIAA
jgi:hypothetical protein